MRIIYIGAFRLPCYDAAAARVLNVARALRLAGHKVSFISWGGEERAEDYCPDGKYRVDGFEYIITHELDPKGGFFNRVKSKLTRGERTKCLLRSMLGCYDAVIAYNGNLARWLISFTSKNHLKLICDLTEWYDYKELSYIDWIPYTFNMRCTQKHVRNKIVISSFFDNHYKNTHNIIVHATCNADESKWHEGDNTEKLNVSAFSGITLIYAGNPARKDAVHYAINAVQRLLEEGAKLRFLIIGIKREDYIKKYSDLLKCNILSEQIQFVGRVSQDDVPSYYALADFMVLLREQTRKSNAGFPTKFSESFTSGTPVIANITSDMGEYLKDAETGFVVKEPTEDAIYRTLKEKVLTLNHDEIDQMKNRVKIVASQLDFHAYVEPLRDFIAYLK